MGIRDKKFAPKASASRSHLCPHVRPADAGGCLDGLKASQDSAQRLPCLPHLHCHWHLHLPLSPLGTQGTSSDAAPQYADYKVSAPLGGFNFLESHKCSQATNCTERNIKASVATTVVQHRVAPKCEF